jgi:hypothetical protein
MSNALRRTFVETQSEPELTELARSPGGSPVHDLQDRLVNHFDAGRDFPQLAVGAVISAPVRMAIIFWTAVGAWAVVAVAIYTSAHLLAV